uniref:DNA polymerase epsilon subunit B n=1 Tax=Blastobotrys adeninivorans TaxID=409370 RepID=A0A060T8D2_BLAAD
MTEPAVLPAVLTPSQVRPVAYRVLSKKHGLNLKSTGLEVLAKVLGKRFGVDWRSSKAEKFLDDVAKQWKEQDRGLFIEGSILEGVIKDMLNVADSETSGNSKEPSRPFNWKDYFKLVCARDQPLYMYNRLRKYYEPASSGAGTFGTAEARKNLFLNRYYVLHDRVLRDETFNKPSFVGLEGGKTWHTISPIKNMLGRNDSAYLLLGMLSKGNDGHWYIQDDSGKVQLDISTHCVPSDQAYYTPGCIVLCTGVYHNSQFIVDTMGPPMAERRENTKEALGNIDFLGVHSAMNATARGSKTSRIERIDRAFEAQLREREHMFSGHKFVILGADIFLDNLRTIDALRKLFGRLEAEFTANDGSETPICIIMPGSFISAPFQANGSSTAYKEMMDDFADLISQFPTLLENASLMFVPGDNDPWAATFSSGAVPVWPLNPIPSVFTNRINRVAPNVMQASNPAKLVYLSQEISIVRDDYGARLRRNEIIFPHMPEEDEEIMETGKEGNGTVPVVNQEKDQLSENEDSDPEVEARRKALTDIIEEENIQIKFTKPHMDKDIAEARKVVRTLLDQGHLSPFPISTRPVSWEYDHTLYLSPLPSMLVLADPTTPKFKVTYQGCHVINPGLFLEKNTINWMEYVPSTGSSTHRFMYI